MWKFFLKNFPVVGSSAEIPFLSVFGHQGAKNCPAMVKISTIQDTWSVSVCTKPEGFI